jgi:multicomponent Na+:H+ antiporter subunit G
MNIVGAVLLLSGLFFYTGGTIGIIRFPDCYTRLHPAGKLDTMGLLLSSAGLAIVNLEEFTLGHVITASKILLIAVFVFIASPTATHAIMDAAVRSGLAPWSKKRGQ